MMTKPADCLHFGNFSRAECDEDSQGRRVFIRHTVDRSAEDIRAFASWLLEAANWLDGNKQKR